MSKFFERLREERKRLGLNQTDFSAFAGVSTETQSNYERGSRKPDSEYLEAIALHGVDVGYLLTGVRSGAVDARLANNGATTVKYKKTGMHDGGPPIAAERAARYLTADQEALLDNYKAADEQGRAAARTVLEALAQPKRANG
ncbi:helix-turn-helix domain-containing protein [Variovorax sp.]|uniref:helix-turn-helix domain-containing protein n=1 Tax=Variovorax sp. TaxID=1871043 RepID=UPI003BAB2F17